jgi:hypothetical protein
MNDDMNQDDYQSRGYPVREDMPHQIKVWRFERRGWYALVVIVILGLLGLFSRGPMSSRDVHGTDGKMRVQYELVHRSGSSNPMIISLMGAPVATVQVELSGEFLNGFSVESMQPEPVRASSAGEGMKLWLQTDTQGKANLYLTLRADGLGMFSTRVTSPGATSVNLDQFIIP